MNLKNILIPVLAFVLIAYLYPGFSFDSNLTLAVASLAFIVLYIFIRPIFKVLTIPLNFVTFGLAGLVLNVLTILAISYLVPGFEVNSFQLWSIHLNHFFSAGLASIILGLISSFLFAITP